MILSYVMWAIAALATALAIYTAVSAYLDIRSTANKLLAIADRDFTHSLHSMLETPKDLPDEVLAMIRMMSLTAFKPGTERMLVRGIRMAGGAANGDGNGRDKLGEAVRSMRPELRKLFHEAVSAWLNIMTHKSTIGGIRIIYAMSKVEAATGKLSHGTPKVALPAMRTMITDPGLGASAC